MPADRWLVIGGVLLFGLSLAMPAIEGAGFPTLSGMDVLQRGASGWRDGVVAWYANPALLVALVACWMRRFKLALGAGLLGLLLALSSFSAGTMAQSAGRSIPAYRFAVGFYLWLLAFVVVIFGALAGRYKGSGCSRPRR